MVLYICNMTRTFYFILLFLFSCQKSNFAPSLPLINYTDIPDDFVVINQPCLNLERSYLNSFGNYQLNPSEDLYELCSSNIQKFDRFRTDENGIYLTDVNGVEVYYPITITQAAATFYKHYKKTGDLTSRSKFLVLANWLKDNFISHGNYGYWYCNQSYSGYNLTGPWPSGFSQGVGLMVMYQAYTITDNIDFLEISEKALEGFNYSVDDKGITLKEHDLMWQYEEYPSPFSSQVLNGFLFALCGLNDYFEATGSSKAKTLFEKGVTYLEQNICKYSLFFTSRYNLYSVSPALANATGDGTGDGYHHLHIQQLLWIYMKTKNNIFYEYATNFLEKDLGYYENNDIGPKILNVDASYSIVEDGYGPDQLNNGVWSYGNYWSTNKDTTILEIDFGKQRNEVNRITLFFPKLYEDVDVRISYYNTLKNEWDFCTQVSTSDSTRMQDYYKTRHFETFINSWKLNPFNTQKVKLEIIKDSEIDIIAIRELDFQFNREEDISTVLADLYNSLNNY